MAVLKHEPCPERNHARREAAPILRSDDERKSRGAELPIPIAEKGGRACGGEAAARRRLGWTESESSGERRIWGFGHDREELVSHGVIGRSAAYELLRFQKDLERTPALRFF